MVLDSVANLKAKFMETKKNPYVDLTKKRSYFFSIGLLIAMSIIVMAFEWRQYIDPLVDLVSKNENYSEALIDIPPTSIIPPPPAAPLRNLVLIEVKNEDSVDTTPPIIDVEITELFEPEVFTIPAPEPEDDGKDIVLFPEVSASPKDGFEGFYKYVSEKIKYPAQARRMGIEGRVFVEFVINKDGSLSDVRSIKGIGAGCDEEAVRIIQSAPAWNPGKQRGKSVKQRYTLPIIFKLG